MLYDCPRYGDTIEMIEKETIDEIANGLKNIPNM